MNPSGSTPSMTLPSFRTWGGDEEVLGDGVDVAQPALEGARGEDRGPPGCGVHEVDGVGRGGGCVCRASGGARCSGGDGRARLHLVPRAPWSPRPVARAERTAAMASQTASCVRSGRQGRRQAEWTSWSRRGRSRSSIAAWAMPSAARGDPMENRPTAGSGTAPVRALGRGTGPGLARCVGTKTSETSCRGCPWRGGRPCPRCRRSASRPPSRKVITISGPVGLSSTSCRRRTRCSRAPATCTGGSCWRTTTCP